MSKFVSGLWQIHAFGEGNTRTTAVFLIKYLQSMGFDVTNDIFAEKVWYFRNELKNRHLHIRWEKKQDIENGSIELVKCYKDNVFVSIKLDIK